MSQDLKRRTQRSRISSASLAGDKRSPLGLFGSLALHGLLLLGMFFTFAHRLDIVDQSSPVVPVDLVTLGAKTNVIASVRPQPRLEEKVTPTPIPPDKLDIHEPSVPQPEEAPPPPPDRTAEAAPKPPPPQAVPKVRPQEAQKPDKKNFDVDNVLALLNKVAPAPSRTSARTGSRNVQGIGAQNAMTADLQSMLLSQIKPCWSPPVGAPHPENLIVDFDVILNSDGSVAQPPQLLADSSASASDPFFRAAAEAARRAIYTCAPYKLPADRYAQWREINPFIFDPRQMMGD